VETDGRAVPRLGDGADVVIEGDFEFRISDFRPIIQAPVVASIRADERCELLIVTTRTDCTFAPTR
jgi:hypothetical protein